MLKYITAESVQGTLGTDNNFGVRDNSSGQIRSETKNVGSTGNVVLDREYVPKVRFGDTLQIHDPVLALRPLYLEWVMRFWELELHRALELADKLMAAAKNVRDPAMLLCGNHARGATLLHLGELVSAKEHEEEALAVFDPQQLLPAELEARRLASFTCLHFGLFGIGYPDRAWAISCEMLEMAQQCSDPYVLAMASYFAAEHNLMRGDGAAAQKCAKEAMALAEKMGLVSVSGLATTCYGASLIARGLYEEGIASIRRGFSTIRAEGGTPFAWYLCILATGLGRIGRPQEGLEVVEQGFASVAKTGEQIASPYLNHVRGELLLAQNPSDVAKAEQCFRTAIEIARRQSAKSEELRATTSLARLRVKQGRPEEARAMLAATYGWFTEGFDTPDLKEAKALLDELAALIPRLEPPLFLPPRFLGALFR